MAEEILQVTRTEMNNAIKEEANVILKNLERRFKDESKKITPKDLPEGASITEFGYYSSDMGKAMGFMLAIQCLKEEQDILLSKLDSDDLFL